MSLVAFLEAAQNADGVLDARLANVDLLEPALQGGVLFDVLAVLVQRRCTDQPQLAAGQHGLEHIAGVHGAVPGGARPDHGVELVDEGDDLALGVLDFLQDGLEPLLEFAAVLGTGHHRGEVQGDQGLAAQAFGNVVGDDPLGQAFDDGGLADAGLADDDGVVLGAAAQDLDDAPDLGIAANHRVQLARAGDRGEVGAVFLQRLERVFRVRVVHFAVAADARQCGQQCLMGGAGLAQELTDAVAPGGEAQQQVFGGNEGVAEPLSLVLGILDRLQPGPGQLRLLHAAPGRRRQGLDGSARLDADGIRVGASGPEQGDGDTLPLVHERLEQVSGLELRVTRGRGVDGGRGESLLALGGEFGVERGLLPEWS